MEAYSWAVSMLAWLVTLALVSKLFFPQSNKLKLPPGPKPWPIIGNLNLIGPLPHQSLHKLSQIYGPIMQLKFGSYPVVIASSAEKAKQFSRTHDYIFASRPPTAAGKYTAYNYSNLIWAPHCPYWPQGRKICLSHLFSPKMLDSYEYIRVEESRTFLSRLCAFSGNPTMLKEHLSRLTLSIISRVVLGKKYFRVSEFESSIVTLEEFQEMLDELFLLNGVFNIGAWIPWVQFLDLLGYVKQMKALMKKFDQFHDHVLDEHKAKKEGVKGFVPKDMVDLLLQLSGDSEIEVKLDCDSVKGFIQLEALIPLLPLEWAMSELLKQPHLIEKATEELDRVIGRNRWVEERDLEQFPYVDAIMKETMRKHPVAVMLAPHLALEDCNVGGYDICKGTRVFINTWSMGRDPSLWDAPDEFRPERFLGKAIDVKGQSFELLPFGSGRRMSPGYRLGLKMIRSSLANLLQGINWKLPENMKTEDLSMEEVFGLTTP